MNKTFVTDEFGQPCLDYESSQDSSFCKKSLCRENKATRATSSSERTVEGAEPFIGNEIKTNKRVKVDWEDIDDDEVLFQEIISPMFDGECQTATQWVVAYGRDRQERKRNSSSQSETVRTRDAKTIRISNLHRVASELNGLNGEATNTDDLPKGSTVGKKILALEKKIMSMMKTKKSGKSKATKGNGRKKSGKGVVNTSRSRAVNDSSSMKLGMVTQLHEDTQKFAMAIADPFSFVARGAGSVINAARTEKATSQVVFNISVNSNNFNVVALSPCVSNDGIAIEHWETASLLDTVDGSVGGGLGQNVYGMASLPYSSGTIGVADNSGNQVQGRVLSQTIRVQSVGPIMNRGGEAIWYESPSHEGLWRSPTNTLNTILNYVNTREQARRVDLGADQEHIFSVHPRHDVESQFKITAVTNSTYPNSYLHPWTQKGTKFGIAGGTSNPDPLAILYFPPGGAICDYRITVITHVEYIGQPTVTKASKTTNHAEHGEMIIAAATDAKDIHHMNPHAHIKHGIFNNVLSELKNVARSKAVDLISGELKKGGGGVAGLALTAALGII